MRITKMPGLEPVRIVIDNPALTEEQKQMLAESLRRMDMPEMARLGGRAESVPEEAARRICRLIRSGRECFDMDGIEAETLMEALPPEQSGISGEDLRRFGRLPEADRDRLRLAGKKAGLHYPETIGILFFEAAGDDGWKRERDGGYTAVLPAPEGGSDFLFLARTADALGVETPRGKHRVYRNGEAAEWLRRYLAERKNAAESAQED